MSDSMHVHIHPTYIYALLGESFVYMLENTNTIMVIVWIDFNQYQSNDMIVFVGIFIIELCLIKYIKYLSIHAFLGPPGPR